MNGKGSRRLMSLTTACVIASAAVTPVASGEAIDLEFNRPSASQSEPERTLATLVRVRGPGGIHLDGLYLLSHSGDRSELFSQENQSMIDNPLIERPWRFCSVFSSGTADGMIVGRNWDNENVGSIIVNLYQPETGYRSISFSRAIDMNLPLNVDLLEFRDHPVARGLLLAPFHSFDGINEHGLVVAVAGVKQVEVRPREGKQLAYVPYLIRMILDRARNVDEAVDVVSDYVPFDLDPHSLDSHMLVADAAGHSAVLEYVGDRWEIFPGTGNWQVMENRAIHGATDDMLRANGWRHRVMSEALESLEKSPDWEEGLGILEQVAQKGTVWSAVYSPSTRDLYFTVYQNWHETYHLEIPEKTAIEASARAGPIGRTYSPETIREDLATLYHDLEVSPYDLFIFTDKTELDTEYERLLGTITEPMTTRDAARMFQSFVVKAKISHLTVEFPVEAFREWYRAGGRLFPFDLVFDGDRPLIAYLRPGAFMNLSSSDLSEQETWDNTEFLSFMDSVFTEISVRKPKILILDIRGNPGGSSTFSNPMIAYVADRPFREASEARFRTSRHTKDFWRDLQDVDDPMIVELKEQIMTREDGERWSEVAEPYPPRTDALRFEGRVVALVDRFSYSNAAAVAAILQDHDFATLVGEETSFNPSNCGGVHTFNLPHTRMEVVYPKMCGVRPSGDVSPHGVIPDHEVHQDYFTDEDEILEEALRIIREPTTGTGISMVAL